MPDNTPVVAAAMRAAETEPAKKDEERYSLFWRLFGGTVLSIAALVGITLYNNLSSNIAELRGEVNRANEARTNAVTELRADLSRASEARADLIRKDEFNSRLSNNWDRVQAVQQQYTAVNATLTSLKTELDGIKDRTGRQSLDLEAMKKDQSATTDALKKDVAALDTLKEKLATLVADLKTTRDDVQKLTNSVDRNQAYDLERKAHRDGQYKQTEETLKELQRGLQDCREKLARLEGQYAPVGFTGPPSPASQSKKTTPKNNQPGKLPIEIKPSVELAPMPREPK
jgi:chromosome segregation ATPase